MSVLPSLGPKGFIRDRWAWVSFLAVANSRRLSRLERCPARMSSGQRGMLRAKVPRSRPDGFRLAGA